MALTFLRTNLLGIRCNLKNINSLYFRQIGTEQYARRMSSLAQQFEEAKTQLNSLQNDPGNDTKLQIYALFKQATAGKCTVKQPGVFDLVGRAKWSAWNSLGEMSKDDAQKEYIKLVKNIASADDGSTDTSSSVGAVGDYKTLQVTQEGPIKTILLNRPTKMNAINLDMYDELGRVLTDATNDPKTVVTVLTGAGEYYCSGNDLTNFTALSGSMQEMAQRGGDILKKYVASFIDFPKILISLVNGPAVGISVTVLGMFDAVLASNKATFHTPFTVLGQSAEGCSTYTFPQMMGPIKANEMLLFNKKLTANEAQELGLVTQVFPAETFQKDAWEKVKYIASLPPNSLLLGKQLSKGKLRQMLHQINAEECKLLIERWQSDECANAIANFMTRKAKL